MINTLNSTFTVGHSRVHDLTTRMLQTVGEEPVGEVILASAMALGRLMSREVLSEEKEILFVQDVVAWAGSYLGTPTEKAAMN